MNLGVFPPHQFFGIVWEGKVLALLYIFDRIPLWSCLVLDFYLLWVFIYYWFNFTTSNSSAQIIHLFLIQFWKIVSSKGIHSFLLDCPLCWLITVHSTLMIFCISVISAVISALSFLILFIWALSPSRWAWLKAHQFIFSKHQILVSVIFSIVFWSLFYLFPLWFLLPSFYWLGALYALLLLIPLHGRLGYLFDISFNWVGLYHYKLCLRIAFAMS